MENNPIRGFHHLTAIVGDPQENIDFYARVLGQRLVKQTVNFDDPGTYHLYYGDEVGSPGTIMTFFPWPGAPRGRRGTGQIVTVAFAIPEGALDYWAERLTKHGVAVTGPVERFNERVLSFLDPHGLALELVTHPESELRGPWQKGPVPAANAIRGFSSITMAEIQHEPTGALLTEVLGFRAQAQDGQRYRYETGTGEARAYVDVLSQPHQPHGRIAVGTVHHVAWRTDDDAHQLEWRKYLLAQGHEVTPVRDRQYFHSIYFNEPGGALFEIATDPPGFATDESVEELGTHLKLPPWLEPRRSIIEESVLPIKIPEENAGVSQE